MLAPSLSRFGPLGVDLKGLKMRIPSSKLLEANERALNAIPQVVAFSEFYQAQQAVVVDGTALAQIKASGNVDVLALTDAQRAEWTKAMWPVHMEMEPRVGAALLSSVYKMAGSNPP